MAKLNKSAKNYKPSVQNYSFTLDDGSHVNPNFKECVVPSILGRNVKCMRDLFAEAMARGNDRAFLGTHPTPTSPYEWTTFKEVYTRLKQFGSGLLTLKTLSKEPFQCVGIFGRNRPEWLITQYACASYKLVSVPLYDTLGDEAILYTCKQAELSVIVCDSAERATKLLGLAESFPFLKHIVIMNSDDDLTELKSAAGSEIQVITFDEVVALGVSHPKETMACEPDDLMLICYTSGTTGLPKGVMISNKMIMTCLNNNILNSGKGILTKDDVYMSYLPMAHIFEQMFVLLTIFRGGRIGFYSGEPRFLQDDANMLKPTFWTTVPRILQRIYDGVKKKIGNSSFKKWLFKSAMESKLKYVNQGMITRQTVWDTLFFSKVRALFGGHIRVIVSGGAPLAPHVLQFTRAAFSCYVFEGYGCTETSSSLSTAFASDIDGGHVGAPVPGLRVKLVDIPSMGIVAARDNRGEICVKGPSCTTGYFKNPERTAELIDSDGWLHMGDVGVWTSKNSLKIVDRCKHIFKLSQGEYVAPEKIESTYLESDLVSQVFVDGDAQQSYPVAIVIPDMEALVRHLNAQKSPNGNVPNGNAAPKHHHKSSGAAAASSSEAVNAAGEHVSESASFVVNGKTMTAEQLCEYEPAIKAVLEDITAQGKARGLKGFEQVRAVRLSPVAFTIDNGMLTPTLKSAREVIRKEFAPAIKSLYHTTNTAATGTHL